MSEGTPSPVLLGIPGATQPVTLFDRVSSTDSATAAGSIGEHYLLLFEIQRVNLNCKVDP